MKQVSKTNVYYDSSGKSYNQSIVAKKITEAKKKKTEQFFEEHGYFFCEDCSRNENCGEMIDKSHTISVKEAKETRRVELSWSISNIKLRCRTCHNKLDGLGLNS